jgi:hypothetical protein
MYPDGEEITGNNEATASPSPEPDAEFKPLEAMSLVELTTEYNRRAEEIEANSTGLKPVKIKRLQSIKDKKTALRKIDELTNPPPVKEKVVPVHATSRRSGVDLRDVFSPETTTTEGDPMPHINSKTNTPKRATAVKQSNTGKRAVTPKKTKPNKRAKTIKQPTQNKRSKGRGVGSTALSTEFGFTAGQPREKCLLVFAAKMGRQIPRAAFGKYADMIPRVKLRIKRKKLKFKLVRESTDDGVTYGLYRK